MGRAISLALAQLFSGPILGVLGLCAILSALTFVGVWFGLDALLSWAWPEGAELDWLGVLEGLATLVLAWFLFPIVASAFVALFLDYVCKVVEKQHYPDLPQARGITILQGVGVAISYLGAMVIGNVLLLFLLFFPPVYAIAWIAMNGYLIGREYVELVALRRLTPRETKDLRRRHGGESMLTGALFAFLMTLPLVNLIVPVFAAALTVHRFHDGRRRDAGAA